MDIEMVKRLVPEATGWVTNGAMVDDAMIKSIYATRRQLEIAVEALEEIERQGKTWGRNECGEWLVKLARHALVEINKVGGS